MNEKLKKIEQNRLEIVESRKKNMLIGTLIIVGAIAFVLIALATEISFLFFLAIVLFLVAFVFFGKAKAQESKYRDIVKKDLVMTLLEDQFEDVAYDHRASIPVDRINSTGTIKRPDRFYGEDYIKGTYKGVKFEVSDLDLKQRVETRDSKGNVHVSYQTYFKGRWYIYQYKKTFDDVLKIVEGRASNVNKKGLEKFDTESMAFNKKFSIYASSKEFGFYLITSSMIEKLLELEALHRGTILYCYRKNELHIGVNDSNDYMEFNLKTPINERNLGIFMSDIELIPAIINEFRLDGTKFR